MRGYVSAAPIKWQLPPTPAKGGNAAIAILQTDQPLDPCRRGVFHAEIDISEVLQRNQRPRRVVCIRDAAAEIRPSPPPRIRQRVRMLHPILLPQQPLANRLALRLR